jgi:uncharacterized membrane protein
MPPVPPSRPADSEFGADERRRAVLQDQARRIAQSSDPDQPIAAVRPSRIPADFTPARGLGVLAVVVLVLLSSFASGPATDLFGVRGFALLLLLVAAVAGYALRGFSRQHTGLATSVGRLAPLATLIAAAVTGSDLAIHLLPAAVHAAIACLMFDGARDEVSLIEKAARLSHPWAPAFIGPYCRKLTYVWGAAFAVSAVVTTHLAIEGDSATHLAWTGWEFWSLLGVFSAVEFVWRKSWFRYYSDGPLDRLLARLFPAENTARGQRSQAYLLQARKELAEFAETERLRIRSAR